VEAPLDSPWYRSAKSAEADFLHIKCWNSQAEAAGDHLGKGRRIAVEGLLRQDIYEKDGEERKAVSIVARRVEHLQPHIYVFSGTRGLYGGTPMPHSLCKEVVRPPSQYIPEC